MLISIIQLAAVLIVPLLIQKYRNGWLTRTFGTIGMAYFYGLLVSALVWLVNVCGADFALNSDIGEIGSYAAIGVAIPLLLFSTDLREVRRLTKTVLLSFGSLIAAVILTTAAAGWLFAGQIPWGRALSAMAVGLYTGGTPNFNAIGAILGVDTTTVALGNLADMVFGGVFYVFILLLAQPLLLKILGRGRAEKYLKTEGEAENVDTVAGGSLNRKIVRNVLLALGSAVIGAGVGVAIWLMRGAVQGTMTDYLVPGVMITGTVLGIALSFNRKVRQVRENSTVGHYLILVFSFALASSLDLRGLTAEFGRIFLLLMGITLGIFVLHVLLSKLLRIGADCTIITLTAGVYGPAFVPAVAGQLKNEKLTAPGLICGALGYAVGTFLGVALYYLF